jgi:alpha-L-fucosidase
MTPERAKPIFDLTCQYPELVINNRLGGGVLGDTATPEQRIATDPLGRGFEVCMTINNSWGYNAGDTRWKTAQQLIRNLSDIAAKGGNYLLNIGPMADGTIPAPEVERLQAMGKWLRTNGEAIYATEAGPLYPLPTWGRSTMKTNAKGGTTLYVHVWNWPPDGKLLLAGIKQPVLSGRLLAGGAAVTAANTADGLLLTLPGAAPDPDVSVAAVEFADPLHIALGAASAQSGFTGTPVDPSGRTPPQ